MLQRRKGPIRRKDRKALWFGKLKNGVINFSFSNTSRVISVNLAALGVSSGNSMSVALFDTHDEGKSVSCCFTDEAGAHWCLKMIKNVNPGRFSNVFVCCGHLCNFKLFYASPSDFCVSGFHRCAFDHEREYRKRVRNQMAMDIIREHVILRPRDVVEMVKRDIELTEREKKSLHQFVSRHLSIHCSRALRSLQELVILGPPSFPHSHLFSRCPLLFTFNLLFSSVSLFTQHF